MSGWELTAGLQNLRNQVDRRWPKRDRTSDGTIGDADHQARTSGHNPDDTPGSKPTWNGDPDTKPEVRAWDLDDDLGEPGITTQQAIDHLRQLPGLATVIRFMIYRGVMWHERTGFEPEPADGHEEHVHFEGAWTQAADNNTTFDFKLDQVGDDMALTAEETTASAIKALTFVLSEAYRAAQGKANGDTLADRAARNWKDYFRAIVGGPTDLTPVVAAIQALDTLPADVSAEQVAELVVEKLAARVAS